MDERTGLEGQERGRRFSADRPSLHRATSLQRPVYRASSAPQPSSSPSEAKVVDGFIAKPSEKPKRTVSKAKPALPRMHKSLVLKRHIAERADQHRKQAKRQHKRHFMSFVVGLVIIAALAVISWAFWDFLPVVKSISIPFISNNQAKKSDTTVVKPASTLDENKPSAGEVEVYQAAVDAPRLLRIPKLDVEARVKRVGTSLTGEPIAPSNIYDVGWYDESAKPGQNGAMLINGHMSGSTKNGVFHDLTDLAAGDQIEIERGDHSVVTYVVTKVQTYGGEQIDMDTVLQSIQPDKNGLNLLTSAANYDGSISRSGKRVIVFAVQK